MIIPQGVANQISAEDREDVLVYSTDILTSEVEATGPIMVHLFAASSAVDTDFTAKLVDVRPDGYAHNIQDGIIRARYRNSKSEPAPIEPGRVYEYVIDLWSTSHLFKEGHRIRIDISSSNFPRFDRNPNTGAPIGQDDRMEVANQSVHHREGFASYVVLPIIPR